jgi:hypothetical protein
MYTITIDETTNTYEDFGSAREAADLTAQSGSLTVEVIHAETDVVAYATSPRAIANKETGEHFVPWTRIENAPHPAPHFPGFVPAYNRKRIMATCYRALDGSGWRVFDGRNGGYADCKNTTESRHLMTEMRLGRTLGEVAQAE